MADRVSDEKLKEKLDEMSMWGLENGKLASRVEFESYSECVEFANEVFKVAEEENHHPEIMVEYGAVEIDLWSHEENTITEKDLKVAELIESALREME